MSRVKSDCNECSHSFMVIAITSTTTASSHASILLPPLRLNALRCCHQGRTLGCCDGLRLSRRHQQSSQWHRTLQRLSKGFPDITVALNWDRQYPATDRTRCVWTIKRYVFSKCFNFFHWVSLEGSAPTRTSSTVCVAHHSPPHRLALRFEHLVGHHERLGSWP
jgi:hypothetical protein